MRNAFIEALEDRRFLSVTAATLASALLKGTTWTYKVTTGKTSTTLTSKVVGPAKVGKITCTEIDATVKTSTSTNTTQSFVHLDSKTGLITYKISAKTVTSAFSTTIVDTPSPYFTTYPATLVAGKAYTFKWTDSAATSIGVLGTTKQTLSTTFTVKLVSEKLTKVTVPAGTFSCYQIQTTNKTTVNGKTTTTTATNYIAPNVGEVKSVSGSTTNVLTKYVKGK